jgi:hypothetical protein
VKKWEMTFEALATGRGKDKCTGKDGHEEERRKVKRDRYQNIRTRKISGDVGYVPGKYGHEDGRGGGRREGKKGVKD